MVDASQQGDGQLRHPSVHHEPTDASFRGVLIVLFGVMVFAALAFYGLLVYLRGYGEYQASRKKSPFPLAPGPSTTLPSEPRLEQLDRLAGVETPNVYERESSKLDLLNGYGPTAE